MTESDLYQWVLKTIKGSEIKLQPIESGTTALGIPDWFYRTKHTDGWIEAKCISQIGTIIKIPFRPGQFSWLMNYAKLKGNALLFVQFQSTAMDNCLAVFQGLQIKREYNLQEFLRENIVCKPMDNINRKMLYSILDRGNV